MDFFRVVKSILPLLWCCSFKLPSQYMSLHTCVKNSSSQMDLIHFITKHTDWQKTSLLTGCIPWFSTHVFHISSLPLHKGYYVKDTLPHRAKLAFTILEQSVLIRRFLTNFRVKIMKIRTIFASCLIEPLISFTQYSYQVGQHHSGSLQLNFLLDLLWD